MDSKVANIRIAEKIDWHKTSRDMTSIKNLKDFAKTLNWRIVIAGGYSLDLYLSLTTRTHRDVDAIIYGFENREEAIKKLNAYIVTSITGADTSAKHENFYMELDVNAPGYGANFYFVETAEDPYVNHYRVKRFDGQIVENTEDKFPKPRLGKMGKFEVEIQDQNAHLADILVKLDKSKPDPLYDQDIENLKHITDPTKVQSLMDNLPI